MKILIIALIGIFFFSLKAMAFEPDYTPLKINFYGSIIYHESMILYGDCGSIYISNNKGNTWNPINIYEDETICKILNHNDTLWCLSSLGRLSYSIDAGITWKKNQLMMETNDTCFNFCINETNIFIRTQLKVISYNRDLQKINNFNDSLIYYPNNEWPYNIASFNAYKFMSIIGNRLILSVFNEKKGKLLILSESLTLIEIIDLKNYLNHPDWLLEIKNKFSYKNKDVFQIGTMLYIPDSTFKKWNYIFSDTTIGNYYYDKSLNPLTYHIEENKIYLSYRVPSLRVNRKSTQTIQNYDIGIKKFDESSNSFIPIGKLFTNDFYTIYPITDLQDGISGVTMNNELLVLNDSIFVCYGANKTILQTQNNCFSWELKSYCDGQPIFALGDSIIYFCSTGFEKNEIFISKNKGITFKPIKANYFPGDGYIQTFANILLLNIETDGKGIIIGSNNRNTQRNILITLDSGFTFNFLKSNEPYVYAENMTISNLIKLNQDYFFGLTYFYQNGDKYYNYLYKMNNDFSKLTLCHLDSNRIIHQIFGRDNQNFNLIISNFSDDFSKEKFFEVTETNNGGSSFESKLKTKLNFEINNIFNYNQDSILITTFKDYNLLMYDFKRNSLDNLFKIDSPNFKFLQLFLAKSKLYMLNDNYLFENSNRNDLSIWEKVQPSTKIQTFSSLLNSDKWFISKYKDDKRKINFYIFDLSSITSVENVEIKYDTHFYSEPAFPVPAKNIVKTKIYWDLTFDLIGSYVGIYNLYGDLTEKNENVILTKLGQNSVLFEWNCTNQENGIYFIIFSYNGVNKPIPILISK